MRGASRLPGPVADLAARSLEFGLGQCGPEPFIDCDLCPRLVSYRRVNQQSEPDWWNGPALSFGDPDARLLIVGLAPGRTGANRTGRPFTGDYAGLLLYETLSKLGLTRGTYAAHAADGFMLTGVAITNAVRCAPPENKPTPQEIATCGGFLARQLSGLASVRVIFALGQIAHNSVVRLLGASPARVPFTHAGEHEIAKGGQQWTLVSSYHCSRYNTQTGRLTDVMFREAMNLAARRAGLISES